MGDSASPTKRRKTLSVSHEEAKDVTKKVQSCDVCRARKVRCVKNEHGDQCEGCLSLGRICSYNHERKKPGPPNGFARQPAPPSSSRRSPEAVWGGQSLSSHGHHVPFPHEPSLANIGLDSRSVWGDALRQAGEPAALHPDILEQFYSIDHSIGQRSSITELGLPWLPIAPGGSGETGANDFDIASSSGSPFDWLWSNQPSTGDVAGVDPLNILNEPQAPSASRTIVERTHVSSGEGSNIVSEGDRSEKRTASRSKRLKTEDLVEWSTVLRILQSYHAHLYPLLPIVHWPTFSQQLMAREDEKSDTWRGFLLSLLAYAIIQLPRSALSFMPVVELRRLHQRCYVESTALRNKSFKSITVVDVATLYCTHIYLGTLGRQNAADLILAEAIKLAQIMGLHDERKSGLSGDAIEMETRRRVFWLLYGSDRTIAALTAAPLHIQDYDLYLPLPMAIDDNLLTPAGAFTPSSSAVPLLSGFHFVTRLFCLLGEILTANRRAGDPNRVEGRMPWSPPLIQLPSLENAARPAQHFLDELERILAVLPGPLQLANPTSVGPTPNSNSSLSDPTLREAQAFAICRANILISQAMVRFSIRQYARSVGQSDPSSSFDGMSERVWVERDVLSLLEDMPSESLAANGDSMRQKVLFVASSLLEKYPSSAEGHSYVSDFLAVYNRIAQEQHAALLEGDSVMPSRLATPMEM